MKKEHSLSVVVTTYMRQEKVISAIRSVARISIVREIVVVDDASPNLTSEWCDLVCSLDARIKLVCLKKNGGIPRARNSGLSTITSSHVMFLDDDDQLVSHGVRRMWRSVKRFPGSPCVGIVLVEKIGKIRGFRLPASTRKGEIWGLDSKRFNGSRFSWAVKQSSVLPVDLIRKLGGFDCQFRTRQWTDLYFQISNEVKVRRVFWPVYRLNRDLSSSRLTAQLQQRNSSMKLLLAKHHDLLHENPKRVNTLVKNHKEMIERTKSGDI